MAFEHIDEKSIDALPRLAVFSRMTDAELRDPRQLVGLARAVDKSCGNRSGLDANRWSDGLFIAESRTVIDRAFDAGCVPFAVLTETRWERDAEAIEQRASALGVDLAAYSASRSVVERITGYPQTRGPLAAFHRRPLPDPAELLRNARRVAVLEDVRNYTNVGAIFRSAAALGIDAVLLTPRCHDPLYRRASRVSMGTVFQVPWTRLAGWPDDGIGLLRSCGFSVAALALTDDAIEVQDARLASLERLALVLGTEGDGLAQRTIAACDWTVRIPMDHGVDSLNVAAASAVAFWELRTAHRT